MSLIIPVGESISIPNGEHFGIIENVEQRDVTLKKGEIAVYLDFSIPMKDVKKADGEPIVIRYSCALPDALTPKNKLGRTMLAMGYPLKKDSKLDVEILIGKECKFVTKNKPNEDHSAEFAEILDVIEKA